MEKLKKLRAYAYCVAGNAEGALLAAAVAAVVASLLFGRVMG